VVTTMMMAEARWHRRCLQSTSADIGQCRDRELRGQPRRCIGPGRSPALAICARRTVKGKETSQKTTQASQKPNSTGSKQQPSRGVRGGGGKQPSGKGILADGTLILGDMVMIAATEISSERIPWESMPELTGVSLVAWVLCAVLLGDYRGRSPSSDNWYLSLLGPPFVAIVDATVTWASSATVSIAIFSLLVSSNLLDSGYNLVLEDLATDNLSPQLEVAVALLITMSCWRGIAARLRGF